MKDLEFVQNTVSRAPPCIILSQQNWGEFLSNSEMQLNLGTASYEATLKKQKQKHTKQHDPHLT